MWFSCHPWVGPDPRIGNDWDHLGSPFYRLLILSKRFIIFLCIAWNCVRVCRCIHQITTPLCAALCSSPFPPSTFRLCSEGRSAVTQGCHMQKKLPSNNIEGCEATVYSPPPHLMCPLPPSLSLSSSVVEMEWHGIIVEAAQPPALWWIQTTDTEQTERRREGGEREKRRAAGRGEVTFGDALSACCLPAAIPPFLSAGGTGRFPQTALLPLCITKGKLVLPQHAVISRTKNTGQQMHHMPGYRHTLMKESSI